MDLAQEMCITDPRVAKIAPYYTWTRVHNARYILYRGRAEQRRDALIVTTQPTAGNQVLAVTGQGMARARQQESEPATAKVKDTNEWLHEFQEWLRRMRRSGRGR